MTPWHPTPNRRPTPPFGALMRSGVMVRSHALMVRLGAWLFGTANRPPLKPARIESLSPQAGAYARLVRQIEDGRSAGAF